MDLKRIPETTGSSEEFDSPGSRKANISNNMAQASGDDRISQVYEEREDSLSGSSWMMNLLRKITVEPVLALYMSASFIAYPVQQDLLYQKICLMHYSREICDHLANESNKAPQDYVQGESAIWVLMNVLCGLIPSLVLTFYLGAYGDKNGRKLPMLFPSIFTALGTISYMCFAIFIKTVPLWVYLVGSVVGGFGGGWVTMLQTTFSYLSDNTSLASRSSRVAVLEAMTFIGALFGAMVVAVMLGKTPLYAPFIVMLSLFAVNVLYISVRIEGTPSDRNLSLNAPSGGFKEKWYTTAARCKNHLTEAILATFRRREGNKRSNIWLLLMAMTTYVLISSGDRDVAFLYLKNRPFNWESYKYGYYTMVSFSTLAFALMFGLPLLKHKLHLHDMTLCMLGLLSKLAFAVFMSFSTKTWMVYTAAALGTLSMFAPASIRAALSKQGESDDQGKLFAMLASLETIAGMIGAAVFNPIYKVTHAKWAGVIYVIMSASIAIPVILTLVLRFRLSKTVISRMRLVEEDDSHVIT